MFTSHLFEVDILRNPLWFDSCPSYIVEGVPLMCVATGQLIVVPSYFDYVRLRNLIKAEASDSLIGLCEYTEHSDAARGRTYFLQVCSCFHEI